MKEDFICTNCKGCVRESSTAVGWGVCQKCDKVWRMPVDIENRTDKNCHNKKER